MVCTNSNYVIKFGQFEFVIKKLDKGKICESLQEPIMAFRVNLLLT
ncbi:26671_t:CDS:2 [Gigaspora margarita]|uniref:26671_t:CDS:1 n=1 Tax=Gigaspora margarita TaxID=4874 RepID=A0ABN7UGV2_GIGMA|nr:26671_t:CDS:2 [Gigaspora margarita]